MPTVYSKSVTEKWDGNKKEIYLCLSIVESDLVRFPGDKNKVQKRRCTFHEPKVIRIKADPNYLDRLN